jgi:hypothetical protein
MYQSRRTHLDFTLNVTGPCPFCATRQRITVSQTETTRCENLACQPVITAAISLVAVRQSLPHEEGSPVS